MRPVINTEKHYPQFSLFAIASGAIFTAVLVDARAAPAVATAAQVREGCKVSAVYIEMWVTSDDAAAGTVITTVEKVPGIGSTAGAADMANLNAYDNKKNIMYTQMGLIPPNVGSYPMAIVKGWFKIPKSKQRFGLEDRLVLNILAQSNGISACGFATFKEQF